MAQDFTLRVNGAERRVDADPDTPLAATKVSAG